MKNRLFIKYVECDNQNSKRVLHDEYKTYRNCL